MEEQAIRVPCIQSRLDFSWGHGTEIQMLEVLNPEGGQGGTDPHLSSVLWNAPTSSHRALALSIAPKQAELHQALHSGATSGRYSSSSNALVAFCTDVREQLDKERDGDVESGAADTVALEAALWGLLELLCIGASRSEGYIAEDLAAWLAEHSPALDALTPPLPPSPDTTSPAQQQRQLAQAAEQAAQGARHCGLTERLAALLESGRPDEQGDYWPAMVHLVAVGRMGDALTLLAAHDAMQHGGSGGMGDSSMMLEGPGAAQPPPASILPQFELLDALYVVLRQMPRFRRAAYAYVPAAAAAGGDAGLQGATGGGPTGREFDNMAEFLAYRSTWQAQCANLPRDCADLFASAQASSPHTVQGVEAVLRVLSGSEPDAVAPTVHWLEFAVAQLVHVRPSLQVAAHLRGLLQASITARPFNPQTHVVLGLLYDILLAMSDQEGPQGVVEVLSSSGAVSTWFMAHVYELLGAVPLGPAAAAAGNSSAGGVGRRARTLPVLARPLPLSGGDQAEYWRLLLAESLMSSSSGSAWSLALSYLAWCTQHGGEAAEIMMEALPVDGQGGDERLLRKALRACESHGMGPQATVLCRAAGAAAWYAGRIGVASRWLGPDGAKDSRRLAAALQPLAAAAGAGLWQKLGCYEPTPLLEGPMFDELAPLLESLSSSFSPPLSSAQPSPPMPTSSSPVSTIPGSLAVASLDSSSSSRACSLGIAAQQHPLLAFLLGIHRVHIAAQSLIDACALGSRHSSAEASVAGDLGTQGTMDPELLREQWGAARALRDALMELLGAPARQDGTLLVPQPLVLPLLAYLVPFMEVAGAGGGLLVGVFSSQDVGVLMRVLSLPQLLESSSFQCQGRQPRGGAQGPGDWLSSLQGAWGPAATGAAPGAGVTQPSTAAHPRYAQDVRLALARFAARVDAREVQHVFGQQRVHQSSIKDATLPRGKRATVVLES